jgi:hypothetical protein
VETFEWFSTSAGQIWIPESNILWGLKQTKAVVKQAVANVYGNFITNLLQYIMGLKTNKYMVVRRPGVANNRGERERVVFFLSEYQLVSDT